MRGRNVHEIILVIEEAPESGYSARALCAPIFTEADDLKLLHAALHDAVRCHYGVEADRPRVIRLHLVQDSLIGHLKVLLSGVKDVLKGRWAAGWSRQRSATRAT